KHRFIDGWETISEMEQALGVPAGSLQETLDKYNADAAKGIDSEFHKKDEWLTPLDNAPWAAFDISTTSSTYRFIALGGLACNIHSQVMGIDGDPIPGLYAAGANCEHFPTNGGEYASGMSLGPGSFFGGLAGKHGAGVSNGPCAGEPSGARVCPLPIPPPPFPPFPRRPQAPAPAAAAGPPARNWR